ncbi:hypothetical protein GLA29479_2880 [Lysobacter antibioticus]|nr:hypothetical protein GLA29479_2880 [Lysobacter antibioticus]
MHRRCPASAMPGDTARTRPAARKANAGSKHTKDPLMAYAPA